MWPHVSAAQTTASKRDFAAEIRAEQRAVANAAGDDFARAAVNLCLAPPVVAVDTIDREPAYYSDGRTVRQDNSWYVEPARVFDDFYFVGDHDSSAWALATPDGIILFDSTYPFWLDDVVIAGMKKVGLDPARIKYVLVSHAHGDHLGGAKILQERYGARVVMGAADWDLVAQYPKRYGAMTPRRDIAVTDSLSVTLGGTTVRAWLTPGHTPGTLSFTFPVRDRGAQLMAVYAGGTGMNFPNTPAEVGIPAYRTYAQSQQNVADIARRAGASVLIANHPWADNALTRMQLLASRGSGKNPFDVGTAGVQRFFRVIVGCARVAQLRLEQQQAAAAQPPLPTGYHYGAPVALPDSISEVLNGGAFRLTIARAVAKPKDRELIEKAERLYPSPGPILDAARTPAQRSRLDSNWTGVPTGQYRTAQRNAGLPEDRWWLYHFDATWVPFAVTAGAVDYYAGRLRDLAAGRGPFAYPPNGPRDSGSFTYSATVHPGTEPGVAFVVELKLEWGYFCGGLCGIGFSHSRTVSFDAAGNPISVTGDSYPRVIVS